MIEVMYAHKHTFLILRRYEVRLATDNIYIYIYICHKEKYKKLWVNRDILHIHLRRRYFNLSCD